MPMRTATIADTNAPAEYATPFSNISVVMPGKEDAKPMRNVAVGL